MPKTTKLPPPMLGTARLLEYARVDQAVVFTGRQTLYGGGKLLGAVPHLALCRDIADGNIYLLHCDENWNVVGVSGGGGLAEIKEAAERGYRGISTKWLALPYSEEQISRYLDKTWGKQRCSFCKKWPWEVREVFNGSGVCICNQCVRSFYERLDTG